MAQVKSGEIRHMPNGEKLIWLSEALIRYGAMRGIERQIQNIEKRRLEAYGHDASEDWQTHINGCLGELAVAVYLGIEWDGQVGDLDALDVGDYQVRTARGGEHGGKARRLILHPGDWMGDVFIHVTGLNGLYTVHGWMHGSEGQQTMYWTDPTKMGRPAYFIPNEMLHKMDTLPREGRL